MIIFLKIVSFITQGTTIDKGTVVVSGTPDGIGYTQDPPLMLKDGDNMTISVTGIGSLTNFVKLIQPTAKKGVEV